MELPSFMFEGSIRGQPQNCFAWPPTFNTKSWRPSKFFLLRPFLKTRAPKLKGFKDSKISSNQFSQCNFWYLFNLISLNFMFCKILLIPGVHLQRYIWFFLFHIMSSNFASYFISHLILSYMFHDLWKVLSWLNTGSMGKCSMCGIIILDYKPKCPISLEFTWMTFLGTLQWIPSCWIRKRASFTSSLQSQTWTSKIQTKHCGFHISYPFFLLICFLSVSYFAH